MLGVGTLARILAAMQLTRLTVAFGAVSDVWLVILLTWNGAAHAAPPSTLSRPIALLLGALLAIALVSFGASLNDVLDERRDRMFRPQRPLPSGRIRRGQALTAVVLSLMAAMLFAASFSRVAVYLTVLTSGALLFFNVMGRFIPSFGVVLVGLMYASLMFVPNYRLEFTLPVWLVMTHAMLVAGGVHVLEGKRPRLRQGAIAAAVFGWAMWSAAVIALGATRTGDIWPDHRNIWLALVPAACMALFVLVAWWKIRSAESGEAAAEKLTRYGSMWHCVYAAAWLLAVGQSREGVWMLVLAAAGFMAMTLLKEASTLARHPLGYR